MRGIQQSARVAYFDIAKGIGILLVLIGHLSSNYILLNFIYIFHMPLFFYIAGIFSKDESIQIVFKKNKKFVLLYFSIGMFYIFLHSLLSKEIQIDSLKYLFLTTPKEIYSIAWFGPLWFLLSLFIVKLLGAFKYTKYLSISIFLFFASYYVNLEYEQIMLFVPLCIGPALMLLIFYNLGKYNNSIIVNYYSQKNILILLMIFIITISLNILFNDGNTTKLINYHQMKILFNPFIALLMSIIGIISIMGISKYIELKSTFLTKQLSFFGRHSLFIFVSHLFFFYISKHIILKFMTNDYINISTFILTLLISTVLILLNNIRLGALK